MKIHLEDDERLEVIVPSQQRTSVEVYLVDDMGKTIVEVATQDGLIGWVREHVVRRHSVPGVPGEDRLVLWGHLVSKHAAITPLHMTLEELIDMHEHEHDGPGTIRNHPRESREHSLHRIGEILIESDDEGPETPSTKRPTAPIAAPIDHEYLASYSGGREVGCHICRKPRSAHPIG